MFLLWNPPQNRGRVIFFNKKAGDKSWPKGGWEAHDYILIWSSNNLCNTRSKPRRFGRAERVSPLLTLSGSGVEIDFTVNYYSSSSCSYSAPILLEFKDSFCKTHTLRNLLKLASLILWKHKYTISKNVSRTKAIVIQQRSLFWTVLLPLWRSFTSPTPTSKSFEMSEPALWHETVELITFMFL